MTDDRIAGNRLLSVSTWADVASFLEISEKRLNYLLYGGSPRYRTFEIPKRRGGTRIIEAPFRELLVLQRRLLAAIEEIFTPKLTANGFVKGRGIVRNARHHLNRTLVLNLDLQDFFHSIHFGRVRGAFESYPFNRPRPAATALAALCCHKGRLPQGAPTSPILSNIVCRSLDHRLSILGRSVGARYSRYADDITFSTRHPSFASGLASYDFEARMPVLGDALQAAIKAEGFQVAPEKTRLSARGVRQQVTGLTVNNDQPNVPREFVRSLRATLEGWSRLGYDQANLRLAQYRGLAQPGPNSLLHHVRGKLAYLAMVRGAGDPVTARYMLEFAKRTKGCARLMGDAALSPKILANALWLVWGRDSTGHETNAFTAFQLDGVGFVSCEHGFRGSDGLQPVSWWIARPEDYAREYQVEMVRRDEHHDFAIFKAPGAPARATLVSGNSLSVAVGAQVTLAGFPHWGPGNREPRIQRGEVLQRKLVSVKHLMETTCSVFPGNSGGPLLDENGRVIGIALYEAATAGGSGLPNSAIDIRHVLTSTTGATASR